MPEINTKADYYADLIDLETVLLTEPPITMPYSDNKIRGFKSQKLILKYPNNNQAVERHVKVVSESAAKVVGETNRDGLVRQKLKSRRLMKCFDTKNQYTISTN